ncbi:glycoside hydrolase family 88/105 protein [Thermoanaerobacterium thermosaccharolyticum]|uniref:glycoside hydrolase family 88/105 protein n=1 Tax=Thermoanaerobacterium thermosaccharolyticum TaxID=1517 RepID=UPI00177CB714|nr:glycoside hydrolase family 88 protein [Thermoanaerobacterium thermosaccharolyticum]MBE0068784.1 glycosyl hydrolase family 88 [Thermoanaerobacterium thermosaccharolyticum]MBE0229584.1 glycosyl hydrolase family 88 [Thermoanaerobacterium thermosaccharolyticum]
MKTIDKFIDNYIKNYHSYKKSWNYEDGCVLKGAWDLYKATGNEKFKLFVLNYLDEFISEDGNIKGYKPYNHHLDDINSGKILFDVLELTNEEKYRKAIESIFNQIKTQPRTNEGNFWHKDIYPYQVWLDGLYMVMPFYVKYIKNFGNIDEVNDILNQFLNVRRHMWNEEKRLYYHGYDESKKEAWADKKTGVSPNFWGRAEGWFVMALVDVLEEMNEKMESEKNTLARILKEAIDGLLMYQDKNSGMWYQVLDKGDDRGNYLETSATLMISYSILKGVRFHILPLGYKEFGIRAFDGTVEKYLVEDGGILRLAGICGVAGLGNNPYRDGSYDYYISEKVVYDDPKGVGALMMAYSEVLKSNK